MRLITRTDLDGLTCAVFITIMEKIDEVVFYEPKEMQDGKVPVTDRDIIANLPYHPNCALWFDHHQSQLIHQNAEYRGKFAVAPSCARVIYDFYEQPDELKPFKELLEETDRVDSAQLTMEDVMNPKGWVLLSYTLDPRSGLDAFTDYFQRMIGWIMVHTVDELLQLPDVKSKVDKYLADQDKFKEALTTYSREDGNVIITDQRSVDKFPSGNRFLIYTLFPKANVSVRLFKGKEPGVTVCAVGHSIFNRSCKTVVGELMHEYGGGGHKGAGTCQFPEAEAEAKVAEIIERLKKNG
ncbi:exopolyphosphatase [bacterium]|nr:exopolyphosphatase [bacterium]NUN45661.1 exopolyphosphatase [bacterium]